MEKISIPLFAALALAATLATAQAHGIWVAERHGTQAIIYGHGASDESYEPAKLTSLVGRAADGSEVKITINKQADHILFEAPEEAVFIVSTFDNGYWSTGADDKLYNKPKDEVNGATEGGRYLKYSIALRGKIEGSIKPQGLEMEIVPLSDPSALKAGDKLDIQLLFNGKPLADVVVISEYTTDSDNKSIKTGPDGKATIAIRNQGLNVLAASFSEDLENDPKADKISHFTTLSFNLDYHSH